MRAAVLIDGGQPCRTGVRASGAGAEPAPSLSTTASQSTGGNPSALPRLMISISPNVPRPFCPASAVRNETRAAERARRGSRMSSSRGRRQKRIAQASWRGGTAQMADEAAAFSLRASQCEMSPSLVGGHERLAPAARASTRWASVRSAVSAGTYCGTAPRAVSRRGVALSRFPRGTRCHLRRAGGRNRRRGEWRPLPARASGTVSPQVTSPRFRARCWRKMFGPNSPPDDEGSGVPCPPTRRLDRAATGSRADRTRRAWRP